MVGIHSSLNTSRGRLASEPGLIHVPPRPAAPIELPRARRPGSELARIIEGEIIPRLRLAHAPSEMEAPAPTHPVSPFMLASFARMVLSSETPALVDYVQALVRRGLPLEAVYVELLIPTARRLGEEWSEDVVPFADVTLALGRLQEVVTALERTSPARGGAGETGSAYFMPTPGEPQTLGLALLEDRFRRAGWRTRLDAAATCEEAVRTVARDRFDVFGLSASPDASAEAIAAVIAEVRAASRNAALLVLVTGRPFLEDPDLASALGADAAPTDARAALLLAEEAIRPLASA